MGLNDVRLNPHLLTALYENVLVETTRTTAPEKRLRTLGENQKNILIAVAQEPGVILPEPELTFLTSVLAACKLSLADVVILNWNDRGTIDYKAALQEFESRFVLLFGLTPVAFGLPVDFPPFQVQAFGDHHYLYAPALAKIQDHKGLKGELWQALKKLFML